MGLLTSDEEAELMRKWIDIVERYNKEALGTESTYEVAGVGADEQGYMLIRLKPKK